MNERETSYPGPADFWLGDKPLVLASASTIRSSMLQQARIPHEVMPASIDERALQKQYGAVLPAELANILATEKSIAVSVECPGHYVLGADQLCVCADQILHKASGLEDLKQKLRYLRNREHTLISAATISIDGEVLARCQSEARLLVRDFSEEFLERYVAAGGVQLLQSSGGYMIEGDGVTLFDSIDGDLFTILGMPLIKILQALRVHGLMLR